MKALLASIVVAIALTACAGTANPPCEVNGVSCDSLGA